MGVSANREFFEKKNQLRVVMSGHGMRLPTDKKFAVPAGMKIFFYVMDGEFTGTSLGRAIEGFTGTGTLPVPTEVVSSGSPVWDYRLSWGSGLTINSTKVGAKFDLITISERDQNRNIPLSILLRDTRCHNAEIHWAACREIKPATSSMAGVGAFNTIASLTNMEKNMSDLQAAPVFNS